MGNDLRRWMKLCEGEGTDLRVMKCEGNFAGIAKLCKTINEFLHKTDGMDVLYRGHHGDHTTNNSFMTDFVGHAFEYAGGAGGGGIVDAFAYNPSDVFYYNDVRFDEMRNTYRAISDKEIKAIYQGSVALQSGGRVITKVKRILRGNAPYSTISGDPSVNDLLVPLLQKFARDNGKNIIAFHGSDYAEYGGQTEYVVGDVSKLTDIREIYEKTHAGEA